MAKSRRERFEDVAGKRVQYVLNKLELLGNCSNRNNYQYEPEDVRKMFSAIRDALKRAEAKFDGELTKHDKTKFKF
ncbi:MAG TPA: hypothetical protein VI603_12530 [Saprospiraceae bacterium]|nr:hypothetical protein [Saprospiraceae bacterium]